MTPSRSQQRHRCTTFVAREAYLAAFHAVEAYLFDRTGKPAKTHRGLRSEFGRLARNDPRIDREFLTFLAEAYEYKSIADYGVGPLSHSVTAEGARSAIDTAARLIDCITVPGVSDRLYGAMPIPTQDPRAARAGPKRKAPPSPSRLRRGPSQPLGRSRTSSRTNRR
jgi:uncharacterized protein (UPF0332 family)